MNKEFEIKFWDNREKRYIKPSMDRDLFLSESGVVFVDELDGNMMESGYFGIDIEAHIISKYGRWISLEDEEPDVGDTVLTVHEYAPEDIAIDYVEFCSDTGTKYFANDNNVTHWQRYRKFEE